MQSKLIRTIDQIIQNFLNEQILQEDASTVRDQHGHTLVSCGEGPAIAFFLLIDKTLGKKKWFINDRRHGGAAWHSDIRVNSTNDFPNTNLSRYEVRGRLWTEEEICAWYQPENVLEAYFQDIEDLFNQLQLNIKDYLFDFDDSAREEGLKPWPGVKSNAQKIEISPEIQKEIDRLTPMLHTAVGEDRAKIEQELDALYKKAGAENAKVAAKKAYLKTAGQKKAPYEKGGGTGMASYRGRLPAIAEDKVQIYSKTLCPKLWDENKKLDPEVRTSLLRIAFDFFTDTELSTPIQDVYLLGSTANYNWTPSSDMDVHLLVDKTPLNMQLKASEKFFRALVGKWNLEHDIKVKGHPVELYLQDVREKNASTGVYSLVKDQWVKEPSLEDVKVDTALIQKKYTMWVQKINDTIKKRDDKMLKKILEQLRVYRQAGLDKQGEFSAENLVFKILRSRGLLDKLKQSTNQFYDKKMSVKDGFDPTSMGPNPGAGQTDDNNGSFYQQNINRMRQMEDVKMKDLKATHPKHSVMHTDPQFEKLTMDNLKAHQDKAMRFYSAAKSANDEGEMERAKAVYQMFKDEIKRRLKYINKPMAEGYGAGIPEQDRLKIPNGDGSVRRWQVRSKDAPKTPKIPDSVNELITELLDDVLPMKEVLTESPDQKTLKKNKKPLTDEERAEVMKRGAVWHHGPKGEATPAVWKAVVKGKSWYCCNTHRAIQIKPTLKGAIKAFEFIKTTA